MEFHKMLALSTAHVKEYTSRFMDNDTLYQVVVYDKHGHGWFVVVPDNITMKEIKRSCPADLYACFELAIKKECDWIMFDNDVEPIDELPVYEW